MIRARHPLTNVKMGFTIFINIMVRVVRSGTRCAVRAFTNNVEIKTIIGVAEIATGVAISSFVQIGIIVRTVEIVEEGTIQVYLDNIQVETMARRVAIGNESCYPGPFMT